MIVLFLFLYTSYQHCVCAWATREEEEEGVCIYVRVCDRVPFTQRQHVEMLRREEM
jgi:hypothetical protein